MRQEFDPNIHHRRSIRIPGYDYSQQGWYFITISTQNKKCIFARTQNDHIRLNSPAQMVETWWHKLTAKFKSIRTDEYIVMPNHFHGIINILPVRAAPCGRPTLGDIVRWFKTMTTNQYIKGVKQNDWPPFPGRLWQRNYYEHIIRNEEELNKIRQYIIENPAKWQTGPTPTPPS